MVILEELEHARERGATIYAEVLGYGLYGDAYHITAPSEDGEGGERSMRAALKSAGLEPSAIDYINAHGTSTPANDKTETSAIKLTFGDAAYDVPISSTKSMHGHLIGGTGAVELLACLMALSEGVIAPTIGYEEPDPECALDVVPNEAREARVTAVLSNAFAFGGLNAVLAFRRWKG